MKAELWNVEANESFDRCDWRRGVNGFIRSRQTATPDNWVDVV